MHPLPQEFLALCRQLGDAQKRCSATMAQQAAQIEALQAQVVRLRAQVMVRDTRLALARDELRQLAAAQPGLPRRRAMARQIGMLAERIASLTRERLRWWQAAEFRASVQTARLCREDLAPPPHNAPTVHATAPAGGLAACASTEAPYAASRLDASLAAADLVICQTGCISHDEYWRVQDHCRRTGKPCILVDQPLAVREAQALDACKPLVILHPSRAPRAGLPALAGTAGEDPLV